MKDSREFQFPVAEPNKFSPKFKDHAEICGFFFAMKCRGASPHLVAQASGINYRTAMKIVSDKSKHYKGIRQEFSRMGMEEFGKAYYTKDIADRLIKAMGVPAPAGAAARGRSGAVRATAGTHRGT